MAKVYQIYIGKAERFKARYQKSKTCGELSKVINGFLVPNDINALEIALDIVDAFTGLDMRQEFLKAELRGRTRYGQIAKARMLLDYDKPVEIDFNDHSDAEKAVARAHRERDKD